MSFPMSTETKTSHSFTIFDEGYEPEVRHTHTNAMGSAESEQSIGQHAFGAIPLVTSKFANRAAQSGGTSGDSPKVGAGCVFSVVDQANTQQKPSSGRPPMADLTSKFAAVRDSDSDSSSNTNPYEESLPPGREAAKSTDSDEGTEPAEVQRLKKELELTRERMAHMDLELTQSRLVQHTMEQAMGSPFPQAQELSLGTDSNPFMSANTKPFMAPPRRGRSSGRTTPFEVLNRRLNGQLLRLSTNVTAPNSLHSVVAGAPAAFGPVGQRSACTAPIAPPVGFDAGLNRATDRITHGSRYSRPSISPTDDYPTSRTPWAIQGQSQQYNYLDTTEPLNYRRLLDRNMNCNWRYIVDKIVRSNDQQASIFLQQKLKIGTAEQKFDIVQCIIDQAYPLMVNRFGNFLVQRCFEHGTPEQITAIAQAIRGNTLNLSMDAFGCHVVQKAFDAVPEEYKAIMVHELLRRIPETVIHRYACHVWQKLFELRWSDSPPQIMKYVNRALRGMWHEVALGETGSLVVQNIFENCLEEDKRPCINEVLDSIDLIAQGQFGNWCIQHICEHGAPPDRTRAIDHVIYFAEHYSTDQFASKVVEKCLKTGGTDFLDKYLERICESRHDCPRMPLIDIAGDQFGNYLMQWILSNADPHRHEIVASHIRKHMVSLRGSKYGSRVAMLCCNPSFTTRTRPAPTLSRNNSFGADVPANRSFGSDISTSRSFGGFDRAFTTADRSYAYPDRGYIGCGRSFGQGNGF